MVRWSVVMAASLYCSIALGADAQSVDYVKKKDLSDYWVHFTEEMARAAYGCNNPKSMFYKSCQKSQLRHPMEQSAHINWGEELNTTPRPPTGQTTTPTTSTQSAPPPVAAQSTRVTPANPLCSTTIYLYRNEPTDQNYDQVVKVCGHEPPE